MRTIKFRGLRTDGEGWAYGLIYKQKGVLRIVDESIDKVAHKDEHDNFVYKEYRIIPETIGQFTGLLDKNGEEVYEGDILEYKNDLGKHCKHNVFYVDGGLAINSHQSDFGKQTPFYNACADMQTAQWIVQCEVIGNIHDHIPRYS
jgi:uncharacterized phage protein (TIGR01671 family)